MIWTEIAGRDITDRRLVECNIHLPTLRLVTPDGVPFGQNIHFTSMYFWRENTVHGNIFLPWMVVDLDTHVLEFGRNDALKLIRRLEKDYGVDPNVLGIYFSGSKGFHIAIPSTLFHPTWRTQPVNAEALRAFAVYLFGDIDSFDQIYDRRRIIRYPGGRHAGSGLFKLQMDHIELAHRSIGDIRARAADSPDIFEVEDPDLSPKLQQAFISATAVTHEPPPSFRRKDSFHELFLPSEIGERNTRASKLAGLLVSRKIDLDLAQEIVKLWNRTNSDPLPERELAYLVYNIFKRYK